MHLQYDYRILQHISSGFFAAGRGILPAHRRKSLTEARRKGLCGLAARGLGNWRRQKGPRCTARRLLCGAAWAWPLAAIGGAKRGRAGRAHTITDTMQTNAINRGSGQRGYWGSSRFFYFTLHFYQKDCARDRQKNRSGREQLTSPPLSSISIIGVENTGESQALITRGHDFQGGLPHALTLYFLHNS